ncbi:hypothetical protein [Azospirillum sp. sgz302134]
MIDLIDAKFVAWLLIVGVIVGLRRFKPGLRDAKTDEVELIEYALDAVAGAPVKSEPEKKTPFLGPAEPSADVRPQPSPPAVPPTAVGRRSAVTAGSRRPTMTVFVERAFDPEKRIGAWHAWIRFMGKAHKAGGMLSDHLHTADHAAVEAVVAGVTAALRLVMPVPGAVILIQTSSEHAIDVLSGRLELRDNRADERAAIERLKMIVTQTRVTVNFRHLHDPGGDAKARTAASTMCETAARDTLDKALGRRAPAGAP